MLLLFEMSTLEGWPIVMYHATDVVGLDVAPRRDTSPGLGLFFLLWIFLEAFCVNNLVIGVIVSNFKDAKVKEDSSMYFSAGQREWEPCPRAPPLLDFHGNPIAEHVPNRGMSYV